MRNNFSLEDNFCLFIIPLIPPLMRLSPLLRPGSGLSFSGSEQGVIRILSSDDLINADNQNKAEQRLVKTGRRASSTIKVNCDGAVSVAIEPSRNSVVLAVSLNQVVGHVKLPPHDSP